MKGEHSIAADAQTPAACAATRRELFDLQHYLWWLSVAPPKGCPRCSANQGPCVTGRGSPLSCHLDYQDSGGRAGEPLFITGHSLGGALADVFALALAVKVIHSFPPSFRIHPLLSEDPQSCPLCPTVQAVETVACRQKVTFPLEQPWRMLALLATPTMYAFSNVYVVALFFGPCPCPSASAIPVESPSTYNVAITA